MLLCIVAVNALKHQRVIKIPNLSAGIKKTKKTSIFYLISHKPKLTDWKL